MLKKAFRALVEFLEEEGIEYLVIGGIAAGVLGEPRATGDIDIDIKIKKKDSKNFTEKLKKRGFRLDRKEVEEKIKKTGTFRAYHGEIGVDFIISSTEFEDEAFSRKRKIRIFKINANFPSPEDLILFKVITGRKIDISDAENVIRRHGSKINKDYLIKWATNFSDITEDMRIYTEVIRLSNLVS